MALTQFVKNNITTQALNLGAQWVGGVAPFPGSNTVQAAWTTGGGSNPLGASATWGQILVQSPTAAWAVSNTAGATLTLTPTDAQAAGVGIDMSSATQNFSLACALALGSSQSWSVASGRTLTVSGVVSGAFSLTKSGDGTLAFTTATTSSFGSGQTFTVGAGLVTTTVANALGSASNSVVVSSGGALRLGATPAQTSFSVTGSGNALQPAAIFFNSSGGFASGKTLTLNGASPTIGLTSTTANAGVINDTGLTGDVTFLLSGTPNAAGATLSSSQNFTVASGSYLVLKGMSAAGVAAAAEFNFSTTDAGPFGAAGNEVRVQSTVGLTNNNAAGVITLSRNYFFDGETSSGTPTGTNTYSVYPYFPNTGTFVFQGTVKATPGNWVKTTNNGSAGATVVQFGSATGGKLDGSGGAWNIRAFDTLQTIRIHQNLDVSTWGLGAINAFKVEYGRAITGAITYASPAVIDNISNSTLTLTHSGYTLAGNLTFTGTSSMSLGAGNVTTGVSPTITVSASTLTIPGNISGTTTLVKNGAGTLTLSGSNTIATSVTLAAGALVLNSAGSVGGTGTQFVFTAAAGAELDSTTGVSLNQTGVINTGALAGSWTWKGTNSLTFGLGNVTTGGDRTITFGTGGGLGTLKFSGAITTATSTLNWNFGGATAGAKQRVTLGGANASQAAGTAADQHAVTSGYFRIENANGLGAVATTTTWWVGATNAGVQTVGAKAALELAGVTTPDTKSVKLYNTGPNDDGALIGASGTSVFSGNIEVPNVAGTRIGVKGSATLTLLGSGSYQNLNPANANTPLSFTAESGGTLNVNRILGGGGTSNAGTVTVTGGTGTVVFSRANLHTGAMTCSSGTTKLTDANAAGAGAGNSVTVTADATMQVTAKVVFPATLTLGSSGSAATFKVSV